MRIGDVLVVGSPKKYWLVYKVATNGQLSLCQCNSEGEPILTATDQLTRLSTPGTLSGKVVSRNENEAKAVGLLSS